MPKIQIKPLSVNEVWKGRRFKTDKYKAYEYELSLKLPPLEIPKGKIELTLICGLSNKLSDIDNIAKPFIDVLQKVYGFNDNQIYDLHLIKQDVKKGKEYIEFLFI